MNLYTYVQFDTAERTLLQHAAAHVQEEDRVDGAAKLTLHDLSHHFLPVPVGRVETAAAELYRARGRKGRAYEAGQLPKQEWDQFRAEYEPAYQVLLKAVDAAKPRKPQPGAGQRKGMSPAEFGEYQRNRVVEFIKGYVAENQAAPSIAEIGEGLDISEHNAGRHVRRLTEEGRLEKGRGHRSLRVVRES